LRAEPTTPATARKLVPGAMIAGRFRVVALLGRGGMGGVYRAEDLRLRETVALKILPGELADDADARSRLEQEVRLARRVTHPNVCRVFDVVDADGAVALCMEYVDGEDLASLLRRVGHLPAKRAMQVARQIVLGVSAIHRQGLLHRDLKPANVMIDGRGAARLMDFGLAAEGPDGLFCGTPAYMAPEQLAAGPASVQSDLYSLSLVLHELFTGESVFAPRQTLEELREDRAALEPRPLDAPALGLPERLAETLARCLSRTPADRPRSTSELLATLPGDDPIAEALAAGETPSPEAVAGAGPNGHVSPRAAALLLLVAMVGLAVFFGLVDRVSVVGQMAPQLGPEALSDRARALLSRLRPEPQRSRGWSGFSMVESVAGWPVTTEAWRRWKVADRGPFVFLYDEPMQDTDPDDVEQHERVGARGVPGEAAVVLSLRGNLRRLSITPEALPTRTAVGAMSWADLLAAAGLPPPMELEELPAPDFVPPVFADERHVWRARDATGEELRVYAAAYAGSPVYFTMRPATARPPGMAASSAGGLDLMVVVRLGTLLLLALGGWLAWRNVRAGRADRRGALRLGALVLLVGGVAQGFLMVLSVPAAREQLSSFVFDMLRWTLLLAALISLLYLALEPEIRRRRPRAAIAWARLLRGGIRDPLVGRELLIGIASGAVLAGLWAVEQWIVLRLGVPWHVWEPVFAQAMLHSPVEVLAAFSGALTVMSVVVFVPLLVWAWLLPLLRSRAATEAAAWVATSGLAVLFTTAGFTVSGVLLGAMIALLSLRVGIVAAIAAVSFWPILIAGAYTTDSSRFYFSNTLVTVGLYASVAFLAWRAAVPRPPALHPSES
jgi:serine/threonine-protein kinase